jgi:hypothetical protein
VIQGGNLTWWRVPLGIQSTWLLGLVVVILGIVAACQSRLSPPNAVPNQANRESIDLRCYYLFDEKSAEAQRGLSHGAVWRAQARARDDASNSQDLFSHRGGGPLGAEWNSDGALYLVASTSLLRSQIRKIELEVGDRIWHGDFDLDDHDRGLTIAIDLAAEAWMSRLRPIAVEDYPLIYSSADLDRLTGVTNSPLGVGKILKINLRLDVEVDGTQRRIDSVRAFHWAGGE